MRKIVARPKKIGAALKWETRNRGGCGPNGCDGAQERNWNGDGGEAVRRTTVNSGEKKGKWRRRDDRSGLKTAKRAGLEGRLYAQAL